MGSWGTAISSNDVYQDIRQSFFDLYNEGHSIEVVTSFITQEFQDVISDYEDSNNFWFSLASAQWDCGYADENVFNRVRDIIINGKDIQLWKELDASEKDLEKRKKVLEGFLEKLLSKNLKPRKRKKKILRNAIFEKGICLAYKLKNGNYGGVCVLAAEHNTEAGFNLIAITTLNMKSKPVLQDFELAEILIQKEKILSRERENELVVWCLAKYYKKAKILFETIGQLPVNKEYEFDSYEKLRISCQWDYIPEYLNNIEEYEKINGKPSNKVFLKEWL